MHYLLQHSIPLAELKPGERAVLVRFAGGKGLTSRLVSLGFIPGTEVIMTQNHGFGPLLITVRETCVALGRGEASRILVQRR